MNDHFNSRYVNLLSNAFENCDGDEPKAFQAVTFASASGTTWLFLTVTDLLGEVEPLSGGNSHDVKLWLD